MTTQLKPPSCVHHSLHLYMTNYSSSVQKNTPLIYQHHSYIQQSLLESITNSESQSRQKHKSALIGPRFTRDINWAAGIFEGEGTLSYNQPRDAWEMSVGMTDRDVIIDFMLVANCGNLTLDCAKGQSKDGTDYKDMHYWRLFKMDHIFNMVTAFYPMLGERRAEKCRDFTLRKSIHEASHRRRLYLL